MQELPIDRRLDVLLNNGNNKSLQSNLRVLAEYVAYMHTNLVEPAIPTQQFRWGSFEQLQDKLEHNLELIDHLMRIYDNGQFSASDHSKYLFNLLHFQNLHRRKLTKADYSNSKAKRNSARIEK